MKNLYVVYSLNERIVTSRMRLSDKVELRHCTVYSQCVCRGGIFDGTIRSPRDPSQLYRRGIG
jgi:hypothetical protein